MHTQHDQDKQLVRQRVWDALDAASAVHDIQVHGRIPDFKGAAKAADRLAELPAWQTATTIKAVPDKAQHPVRARALAEGKTVYMAVPKLATPKPFYLLDPKALPVPPDEAASSRVAASVAPTVAVDALRSIDIVVLGSVAVNRQGLRIGKGAGYSDLEFAFLTEAGLIRPDTLVVTTVHPLQVVDSPIPATQHDVSLDLIITPDEVITCPTPHRPSGIMWDHLDSQKIAAIPFLQARYAQR